MADDLGRKRELLSESQRDALAERLRGARTASRIPPPRRDAPAAARAALPDEPAPLVVELDAVADAAATALSRACGLSLASLRPILDGLAAAYAAAALAGRAAAAPGAPPSILDRLRRLAASAVESAPGAAARAQAATLGTPYELVVRALRLVGEHLPAILTGEAHALEVLAPAGSTALLEGIYGELPESRAVIDAVAAAVGSVRAQASGPLRILELGGGVGATTRAVVAALADRDHLVFTDVSPLFLADAERRFGGHPGFATALCDIDALPDHAPPGRYHLVVATNVLHCARRLRSSLTGVRALLIDGGLLVAAEATRAELWHDISLALLPGYLAAEDERRAAGSPLLDRDGWLDALSGAGFSTATALPHDEEAGARLCEHVLLARS